MEVSISPTLVINGEGAVISVGSLDTYELLSPFDIFSSTFFGISPICVPAVAVSSTALCSSEQPIFFPPPLTTGLQLRADEYMPPR